VVNTVASEIGAIPSSTQTKGGLSMGVKSGRSEGQTSWKGPDDGIPEARGVAHELDANHAADPGHLREIGTCRECGFLIGLSEEGTWSHRPSVGEVGDAEDWLDRH
jgi:hypothetical protein